MSLPTDFFPGVLDSELSCTLGDRLGVGASLGKGASLDAFLVLRQLVDTSRAGEGSVPVGRGGERLGAASVGMDRLPDGRWRAMGAHTGS